AFRDEGPRLIGSFFYAPPREVEPVGAPEVVLKHASAARDRVSQGSGRYCDGSVAAGLPSTRSPDLGACCSRIYGQPSHTDTRSISGRHVPGVAKARRGYRDLRARFGSDAFVRVGRTARPSRADPPLPVREATMPETADFAIDRSRRVRAAARHVCDAAREIVASSRAISAAREPEGTPECGGGRQGV